MAATLAPPTHTRPRLELSVQSSKPCLQWGFIATQTSHAGDSKSHTPAHRYVVNVLTISAGVTPVLVKVM